MKQSQRIGIAVAVLATCLWMGCTLVHPPAEGRSSSPTNRKEWRISEDLQVTQLRPGVWMHTSWKTYPNGSRYPSNGLIIQEGEDLTLVDTAWGVEATSQLLAWVNETLRCPVTRAVITHSHDDRSAGIPVLVEQGIPVFAESRTVALTVSSSDSKSISLGPLGIGESAELGQTEVFFPGPGHSPDNVVVWIPAQRILFGGCLVKPADATTPGNTNDANLVNWPAAIDRVQERFGEAELVVPGHGAIGGRDLLDHTRELIEEIQVHSATPTPVILDTDIGSDIDDTWALVHLLKSPELDPKLILTCSCDTDYRARLTARLLQVAGRTDIPIGMGPQGAPCNEFQQPWLAGFSIDAYPGRIYRDGVQQLINVIHASPLPVTIIAIGPTGNIAEALQRDPSIAAKTRYVGMQGSIDVGYGDGPPVAEANVRGDAAAFRSVLEANWLDLRITPLDTCGNVALAGERYQRLRRSGDPLVQALIENYRIWSGLVTWIKVDFLETRSSTLFDLVATYMAYNEEDLEFETIPIRVTDDGMTVRDAAGVPVKVAIRWKDQPAFLDHLTRRLVGPEPVDPLAPKE